MAAARNRTLVLVLLVATIAFGLFLRVYWNADAAHTPDGFVLSGGSDPYYHKWAIDHIQDTGRTLREDPLLNYPVGSINPNPPLFQWSIAVSGQALAPVLGGTDTATWWAAEYAPAVWGALTIVPVFLLARLFAGPWAGLLAAFFVATSPEHLGRSGLGSTDHDPAVICLAAFGFYFLIRAIDLVGTGPEHTPIRGLGREFARWFREDRKAAGSALVAGAFFGGVALTWKGFTYIYGVILAYAVVQFLVNHWRNRDVAHPFFVLAIALVVSTLMGLPYYASFGLMQFWNPALFLVAVALALGLYFIWTQHYPSILVVPGLVLIMGVFAAVMLFVTPEIGNTLLNRLVYFRQTRLYQTIAEAHPAGFSELAFTIGPVPFFLYVVGMPWLAYRVMRERRPTELFLLIWVAVDLYMGLSAVRFLSQAVLTMSVLAAAATVWVLRPINLPGALDRYRMGGGGFRGARRAVNLTHAVVVVLLVSMVLAPNMLLAVDAGVPADTEFAKAQAAREAAHAAVTAKAREIGEPAENVLEYQRLVNGSRDGGDFRRLLDDMGLRLGLESSVVDQVYDAGDDDLDVVGRYSKRLGAFGQSFIPESWQGALGYLGTLDTDRAPADRPAFLAWWDYGHWAIAISHHPTVADNFQNGYRLAGAFLTARNESHAVQLLGARHAKVQSHDEFVPTLTATGVSAFDADRYYTAFRGERFPHIAFAADERENVRLSAEWVARVEAVRGDRIRYIAVDSRMLPIDDPTTQYIESAGIFYAPVTLAGGKPETFVRDKIVNLDTGAEVTDAQIKAMQRGAQQANLGQRLDYMPAFFDSMFYRGFMGLPARAPVSQGGQEFPIPFDLGGFQEFYQDERMLFSTTPVSGAALSNEVAPGFGLRHFRLIYANTGVRLLEYVPGAILEGAVTLGGEPLPGARVTVFDDAGEDVLKTNPDYFVQRGRTGPEMDVPHDSVLTDEDGSFRLVAPFSTGRGVLIKVTQEIPRGPPALLTSHTMQVTRAQANAGDVVPLGLEVEPAAWTGTTFLDADGDGTFTANDTALSGAEVSLQGLTATSDSEGEFSFDALAPGSYTAEATLDGYRLAAGVGRLTLAGGDRLESDLVFEHLPVTVTGKLVDEADAAVEGVAVRLDPAPGSTTARPASAVAEIGGALTLTLQPGTYRVHGNGTDGATNETLEIVGVDVIGGTGASVDDDGLLVIEPRAADVTIRVRVERDSASG